MTLCEKCIHGNTCASRDDMDMEDELALISCFSFKNKADFVEVVRCKECEHGRELNDFEKRCYIEECVACSKIHSNSDRLVMLPTDFCSYGERKDEE